MGVSGWGLGIGRRCAFETQVETLARHATSQVRRAKRRRRPGGGGGLRAGALQTHSSLPWAVVIADTAAVAVVDVGAAVVAPLPPPPPPHPFAATDQLLQLLRRRGAGGLAGPVPPPGPPVRCVVLRRCLWAHVANGCHVIVVVAINQVLISITGHYWVVLGATR